MKDYLEIVTRWYEELREPFTTLLLRRYSTLGAAEVEDIYQEVFLAIHKNLREGRVAEDTNWKSYVVGIGLNMAATATRGRKTVSAPLWLADGEGGDQRPSEAFAGMPPLDVVVELATGDAQERERQIDVVNDALDKLREPCSTLLRDFYYNGLSLAEIRDEMGYSSTDTVKSKRYKCFARLKRLVMRQLNNDER